jgi:heavy metal sensor kinase
MNRLPIRLRLTLAFATAIAAVLAAGGLLLYHHLAGSLDHTLDQGLRARSTQLAALVKQADPGLKESPPAPISDATGSFAQVLDSQGRITDQTRGLGPQPLLAAPLLDRARAGAFLVSRVHELGTDVRLLAVPVQAENGRLVLNVGAPLHSRDQTLANLRRELLVGAPIALLFASFIGYLVAAGALRPVERMRARAASITDRDLSERLPVPPGRDEIARLGETLNDLLGRLERGIRRERSFVADASHELRAPLALVRAEVELALDAPRDRAELEAALRSIGEEGDRLSQLADDLLLLARLDEGKLSLRKETIDPGTLLGDVAARFERRAADAGRAIEVDLAGHLLIGDPMRLEQAVVNLVENSLRHGAGTIRLSAAARHDGVEIRVSDEGPGFPAHIAETAFERFTRADTARSSTGAGLGLAIVRAIVEAHDGSVMLGRQSTGGADVVMTLPTTRLSQLESSAAVPDSKRGGVSGTALR